MESKGKNSSLTNRITRRKMLKYGLCGTTGLVMSNLAAGSIYSKSRSSAKPGKAKAVIQIWMWGGPTHLDTFDPKPNAGPDYCGPYTTPIETNVKGIRIGQMLPLMAKQADKYSIIRSITHGINSHETASYMVQTGRKQGREVYPCVGAVVSLKKGYDAGYKGLLPPYIVLTSRQGRFSESGFLAPKYKPFVTGGDPAKNPFLVEGIIIKGITEQQQKNRRDLLHSLDTLGSRMKGNEHFDKVDEYRDRAYEMILGNEGKVFDLSTEKDELRDQYGRNTFGASCLIARKLVQRGVRYVTINYKGWDTHKKHFETMQRKLPELDKGFSTLLQDLSDHGLLDSTIVWWGGEFGRGPKIQWDSPWNGGRSHHGAVFSHVVAGGGFKGGRIVGSSDELGKKVKERPVYPWDLIGSMYELLGISGTLPHPQGKPIPLLASSEKGEKSEGLLKEIM